ncbi:MAG: RpiB/LacA/LacB family sugar-phosphate isomerase [Deltaproteobacteria bacterium]|nr:RpiB/LacA/LacB family sugar-phosphate isomerase [Deltaproteobacteria bacterium]
MRIAVCSDEPYAVHDTIRAEVKRRGHELVPFGSLLSGHEEPWAEVAERAALAVATGECDEGIFLCWTGTGVSMAANKVAGIRAALCTDPGTAKGARVWNHANVLCLSNRLLSNDLAKEILEAWFGTPSGVEGSTGVARLKSVDARHRVPGASGP